MDQKELKTSWKQRIIISVIAILLLGSTIATYVLIVLSNNKSNSSTLSQLQDDYTAKQTEINQRGYELSNVYFDTLNGFKSEVKGYNAEAANATGVQKRDLKIGDGRELATGDLNYFAYYIGWCPDESIFDSSFNDNSNPTSLKAPIYAGQGLIEGWNEGVVGMKIDGVREITVPGELAYGESREICGMTNAPLKFIILPITDNTLYELNDELEQIYAQLVNAYYSNSNSSTGGGTTTTTSDGTTE